MSVSPEIQSRVDALITDNAVIVFSKSYCPYCKATKALLTKKSVAGSVLELDLAEDGDALQSAVQATSLAPSQSRSVPQVFIKGKRIGGNDAVQALDGKGGLDELLEGVEKGSLSNL